MEQLLISAKELILNIIPNRPDISIKLAQTLAIGIILWLIHRVIIIIIKEKTEDIRAIYSWRKGASYLLWAVGFILTGRIWFEGIEAIGTFLGLVSAGVAIALKDVLTDIAGWVYIVLENPIRPGDRIEVDGISGDVIDIGLFQFTILEIGNWVNADQSTGRLIEIPNAKVFTSPIANSTKAFPYIWNELPVEVEFESNWKKAKKLLTNTIANFNEENQKLIERSFRKAKKDILISYRTLTPTVYTSVKASSVCLTIRYLCDPKARRTTEHELWENILTKFAEHDDIEMAYPTHRMYRRNEEH